MTEREYINVSDLQRTRMALRILGDIVPGKHIPQDDLRQVMRKLGSWESALNAVVTTEPVPKKGGYP